MHSGDVDLLLLLSCLPDPEQNYAMYLTKEVVGD